MEEYVISLRHTSVTYKLKLSGGDGDSGHAQADMVTEIYGHTTFSSRGLRDNNNLQTTT